ncbi:MAG: DUF4153 domain-containing protein [Lachnospiraceae bacterium]|nr:DUF4153 domain-containing protein [Lachnospiraceae bacterium]
MRIINKLFDKLFGLAGAVIRYPFTTAFLIMATVLSINAIYRENQNDKQLLTCAVGAILCAVIQMMYERFFNKNMARILLYLAGLLITAVYYLLLLSAPDLSIEITVRTTAALLALLFAYLLIPVFRSRYLFHQSFFIFLKSFFITLLYAGVLFGGVSLILTAVDQLILPIPMKSYGYSASLIFILFAPIYLFSQIPVYPGSSNMDIEEKQGREEQIFKAANCSRFIEILISYIVIPLAELFTLILILYILKNIRGEFWTNNLMEPMLVSYAIAIIIIFILSSILNNRMVLLFQKIVPKILIPIVLFQMSATVLRMMDIGVKHTGYYILLFGVFAVCSGVIMSFLGKNKNDLIAILLILFSLLSIIPPVDAFTISKWSQKNTLESVLTDSGMLSDGKLEISGTFTDEQKRIISSTVGYLDRMQYTKEIPYLPEDFKLYEDFYDTFGFYEYEIASNQNKSVVVFIDREQAIMVEDYEYMAHSYLNSEDTSQPVICNFKKNGEEYVLKKRKVGGQFEFVLQDQGKNEFILFYSNEIFDRYEQYAVENKELTEEEASFYAESDEIKMKIIVQEASMYFSNNRMSYFSDFYVLIK